MKLKVFSKQGLTKSTFGGPYCFYDRVCWHNNSPADMHLAHKCLESRLLY